VIAGILWLGEALKTEIMYSVNIDNSQLQKYLDLIQRLDLADNTLSSNHSVTYLVTPKGLKLLRSIDTVLDTLKDKELVELRH